VTRILRALLCGLTIALVAGATGVVAQAAAPSETGAAAPPVRLVQLDGPLDRAAQSSLSREIDAAGDAGDALVLIRLDGTSGPADDMRDALDAVGGSAAPVASGGPTAPRRGPRWRWRGRRPDRWPRAPLAWRRPSTTPEAADGSRRGR
jgi:membrane-bound ClpP family serine protease